MACSGCGANYKRKVPHSNERVARYGPDLFTYENPKVLFEIKTNATSHDVFEGVGQLLIYERLLRLSFRKVLVVPDGVGLGLVGPLGDLKLVTLHFRRKGSSIVFDDKTLTDCLAP